MIGEGYPIRQYFPAGFFLLPRLAPFFSQACRFINLNGRFRSLEQHAVDLADPGCFRQRRTGQLRHQNLPARTHCFQPAGQIDRSPDAPVFHLLIRSDISDGHHSGTDPDPHFNFRVPVFQIPVIDLRHGVLHFNGTGHSRVRMPGVFGRCAENHEDAISQVLNDGSLVPFNDLRHLPEIMIQQLNHGFRRQRCGKR